MAKYNTAKRYNTNGAKGGAIYNVETYILVLKLNENIDFLEELQIPLAKLILSEKLNWIDALGANVENFLSGTMSFVDSAPQLDAFFEALERVGLIDKITELIVDLAINEDYSLIEEMEQFAEIFAELDFHLEDTANLEAFIETADEYGFEELAELFANILTFHDFNMTDKQPKSAISDFYVTKDEDGIFDIIKPFNLIVDYSKTKISFMPEATDTISELVGIDGEIVQDTVYRSRMFDIFAVTEQGLTLVEKEEIKKEISEILHSIKTGTKVITFANNETEFDVKYSGLADIVTDAPGWMRFELPLKSPSSYGRKQFNKDIKGSGLMENTGVIPTGPLVKITGPCENPAFLMGDVTIEWKSTIAANETLYIDMENETCYKINANGEKINAMKHFNGEFKKIPVGSLVLEANQATEEHISATWIERVLY